MQETEEYEYYKTLVLTPITVAGQNTPTQELDIPGDCDVITGIRVESDSANQAYDRLLMQLLVSDDEIFPPQCPVQFLMFSIESAEKFHNCGEIKNTTNKIKVTTTDYQNPFVAFTAYNPRLVIRYRRKKHK